MSTGKLFGVIGKLKTYGVKIGDLDLIKESIVTAEINFRNDVPVILGRLIITDIIDMNNQVVWRNTPVKIHYIDIYDKILDLEFYITNIIEGYTEDFKKTYIIDLQDKFSHVLSCSYLSKSFNTDIITALNSYITELKLTSFKTDFESISETLKFTVPKNINNLTFFMTELFKRGYSFYRTRDNIVIKHMSKLVPSKLIQNNADKMPYMTNSSNQFYKNKINAVTVQFNKRDSTPPITKSIAYNHETKNMDYSDDNDNSPYYLGNDIINLQTTLAGSFKGILEITQPHLNFDMHKLLMKFSFMRGTEIEIVIPGFNSNEINQIYKIEISGNKGSSESQTSGNMIMSGKYVANTIMDKLIGDTLIQKIHLYRTDMNKKVK